MSYAAIQNVKSLFRHFADNSEAAVTDTEIQEFLDDAFSIINAKIGTLYTLPITLYNNPESYNILKRIEAFKVAGIVDEILNSYSEGDKKPGWEKKSEELLNSLIPQINKKTGIQDPPVMKLPDATYLGTPTQQGRAKFSATSGTIFQKGVDTW